jgi:hypothetical protein
MEDTAVKVKWYNVHLIKEFVMTDSEAHVCEVTYM